MLQGPHNHQLLALMVPPSSFAVDVHLSTLHQEAYYALLYIDSFLAMTPRTHLALVHAHPCMRVHGVTRLT